MHRNDIEIGLWEFRFVLHELFLYAKYGFKWCKFVLNIFLFVLLGAYGVVLRCRHKVTEVFSNIFNSLLMTKSNIRITARLSGSMIAVFSDRTGKVLVKSETAYNIYLRSYYRSQLYFESSPSKSNAVICRHDNCFCYLNQIMVEHFICIGWISNTCIR